jgi:hypothetical protein
MPLSREVAVERVDALIESMRTNLVVSSGERNEVNLVLAYADKQKKGASTEKFQKFCVGITPKLTNRYDKDNIINNSVHVPELVRTVCSPQMCTYSTKWLKDGFTADMKKVSKVNDEHLAGLTHALFIRDTKPTVIASELERLWDSMHLVKSYLMFVKNEDAIRVTYNMIMPDMPSCKYTSPIHGMRMIQYTDGKYYRIDVVCGYLAIMLSNITNYYDSPILRPKKVVEESETESEPESETETESEPEPEPEKVKAYGKGKGRRSEPESDPESEPEPEIKTDVKHKKGKGNGRRSD